MELPNIAAYAYQDVHVWSALLTCLRPQGGNRPDKRGEISGGGGGGLHDTGYSVAPSMQEIPSKRVVRSSAGADAIYPLFLGVIRVRYPKEWYWMFDPL